MKVEACILAEGQTGVLTHDGREWPVKLSGVKKRSNYTEVSFIDRRTGLPLLNARGGRALFVAEVILGKALLVLDGEIPPDETERSEKTEKLKQFFEASVEIDGAPFVLDDEQLTAVASDRNALVTARAGSGKTRVIVGKIVELLTNQNMRESNIKAFCFNNGAKAEINDRLNNRVLVGGVAKYRGTNIATTFHAFAKKICGYDGEIVTDRTGLIKEILNKLRTENPELDGKIYAFFRKEILNIDSKNFSSEQSYYEFIRNTKYTALNGEKVKSVGEKIIADYLFEHGIKYVYEKPFYQGKKETRPDFYLPDFDLVWEHWAVDGSESPRRRAEFTRCVGDYDEYLENKKWKREFWSKSKLIETENSDFTNRETAEDCIRRTLAKHGIVKEKLDERVLRQAVWEKSIDGFTLLIDQFINKLQQNDGKINCAEDERVKTFCEIGMAVYERYAAMDFNRLLHKAVQHIRAGNADEEICNLRYILIDEYQDFSALFFALINAMLERNNNITLFCVGDDWQAINRFAGADLKFFNRFTVDCKDAETYVLSTNYRSAPQIVGTANLFADSYLFAGKRMTCRNLGLAGTVATVNVSSEYVDMTTENKYTKCLEREENYLLKLQYLKACAEFIEKHKNVLILSRANKFLGNELDWFRKLLEKTCGKSVQVKTVHQSKGEECENVILLNLNEGAFPVYSPNSALFSAFGESLEDAVTDEQKLFYVALTRAKKNILLLYEEERMSSFLTPFVRD